MAWIVIGEEKDKIKLVSKENTQGILPKGSYLTVEQGDSKFILRVDESKQSAMYSPSPLVVDMDLKPLYQDQFCRNVIWAYRVKDVSEREDGLIDFIRPQSQARRSSQEEIDLALGSVTSGPPIFMATVHASQNQILRDCENDMVVARIPEEAFYHQIMICGKTGSGKTVAAKYLAQHFVEEMDGAVLAINVKDVDFLRMDKESTTSSRSVEGEWKSMDLFPHGVSNYTIYYPANTEIDSSMGVDYKVCKKITLDVDSIEPESLTGLLQGISDVGAQNLPNIFRYWQEKLAKGNELKFADFINYFNRAGDEDRYFNTMNARGDEGGCTLHSATFNNVIRNLDSASEFFDNEESHTLGYDDILSRGKMSVINVSGKKGVEFGSILLRDLLHQIVEAKSKQKSSVPILIVIDEVHQFYNTSSSKEALGDLDTICRTGRSQKIGVLFSSQNPSDIPRGLSSVINTKLFFKTDASSARSLGVKITDDEMENLRKGYCAANVHEMSQMKVLKFPLSLSGVFEE